MFVLCNGRSGSTLLRFLLDGHPDLACPPETNVPNLCAQLATVWSLIEGAPLATNRGDEPPEIPDAAIAGIRATMNMMLGSYLRRRGKKLYCDKSLGAAPFADLLLRVYPQARFLCLYRHPMDVIASGVEACPWGLTGYGFEQYVATTPGNAVLALARFWIDNTAQTLAVEQRLGDHCLRVRYEDLATNPELTASAIFKFLGAAPAPGISKYCFSADRERFGPADHKIWYTSEVTAASIGRGWSVPAALIPSPVLTALNELNAKLGYLPVDGSWGTSAPPADLRLPIEAPSADEAESATAQLTIETAPDADSEYGSRSRQLVTALEKGLWAFSSQPPKRSRPHAAETFVAVWIPRDPRNPAEHWLVDLAAGTVSFTGREAQEDSDWDIVGSADAWDQVLSGDLNLSVALRACQLRYCDGDESRPLAGEARVAMLGFLLGLTDW